MIYYVVYKYEPVYGKCVIKHATRSIKTALDIQSKNKSYYIKIEVR